MNRNFNYDSNEIKLKNLLAVLPTSYYWFCFDIVCYSQLSSVAKSSIIKQIKNELGCKL